MTWLCVLISVALYAGHSDRSLKVSLIVHYTAFLNSERPFSKITEVFTKPVINTGFGLSIFTFKNK